MNKDQISGRLGWLGVALATQRNNLTNILLRLKDAGLRAGTSFSLHRKFMHLLEQVATDRDKELAILNEIEEVERQHLNLKQRNLLRCVTQDKAPRPATLLQQADEKPKRTNLLSIFGILYLFSSKSISDKKQSLTID